MARRNKGPITRLDNATYSLNIESSERAVLNSLFDQLRDVLMNDSDSDIARRLFPAAYHQDEQHEAEYQRLMHHELLSSRLTSLSMTADILGNDPDSDHQSSDHVVISVDQLDVLMRSVNSLRLVLGTLLDVHEDETDVLLDEDDPAYGQLQLYSYLGWLLEWMVTAQTSVD